jgi:hypothetical protein
MQRFAYDNLSYPCERYYSLDFLRKYSPFDRRPVLHVLGPDGANDGSPEGLPARALLVKRGQCEPMHFDREQ